MNYFLNNITLVNTISPLEIIYRLKAGQNFVETDKFNSKQCHLFLFFGTGSCHLLTNQLALGFNKSGSEVGGDIQQPPVLPGAHLGSVVLHSERAVGPVGGLEVGGEALDRLGSSNGHITAAVVYT